MKLLHAADLHLDSAFAGLSDREAALCREESRTTVRRLVDWGNDHGADVMLLAGDLFDSDRLYSQTAQTLALATMIFTPPAAAMTPWPGRKMCIFSPPRRPGR